MASVSSDYWEHTDMFIFVVSLSVYLMVNFMFVEVINKSKTNFVGEYVQQI